MRIYTMLTGLMETNCYLVVTKERHIAVIDPGADPETIIAKLEDLGSEPSMTIPALWKPSASAIPTAR